jgi:hypothetical protein
LCAVSDIFLQIMANLTAAIRHREHDVHGAHLIEVFRNSSALGIKGENTAPWLKLPHRYSACPYFRVRSTRNGHNSQNNHRLTAQSRLHSHTLSSEELVDGGGNTR